MSDTEFSYSYECSKCGEEELFNTKLFKDEEISDCCSVKLDFITTKKLVDDVWIPVTEDDADDVIKRWRGLCLKALETNEGIPLVGFFKKKPNENVKQHLKNILVKTNIFVSRHYVYLYLTNENLKAIVNWRGASDKRAAIAIAISLFEIADVKKPTKINT